MSLFGDVGKFFEHAIHSPVVQTIFPPFAVGNILASTVAHKAGQFLGHLEQQGRGPLSHTPQNATTDHYILQQQPMQPWAGGSGLWDYSTPSLGYSTLPQPYQGADYSRTFWGLNPN